MKFPLLHPAEPLHNNSDILSASQPLLSPYRVWRKLWWVSFWRACWVHISSLCTVKIHTVKLIAVLKFPMLYECSLWWTDIPIRVSPALCSVHPGICPYLTVTGLIDIHSYQICLCFYMFSYSMCVNHQCVQVPWDEFATPSFRKWMVGWMDRCSRTCSCLDMDISGL